MRFLTCTDDDVREITRRMTADLQPAIDAGDLALPIDREFALDEVAEALAHMRANRHFGKIALIVSD